MTLVADEEASSIRLDSIGIASQVSHSVAFSSRGHDLGRHSGKKSPALNQLLVIIGNVYGVMIDYPPCYHSDLISGRLKAGPRFIEDSALCFFVKRPCPNHRCDRCATGKDHGETVRVIRSCYRLWLRMKC